MFAWAQPLGKRERVLKGTAIVDTSTKNLIRRIRSGEIAVIDHRDLDEVAAGGLIAGKVRAVLNCAETMSGTYPTPGPERLLAAGIPVLDGIDRRWASQLAAGTPVWVEGATYGYFDTDGNAIAVGEGKQLTPTRLARLKKLARANLEPALDQFIDNTLAFAAREKHFVTQPLQLPPLATKIKGRHVVVVVRGANYTADLYAIRTYIRDYRPVLVGVDGGADALLQNNYTPDLIVGDMDSVSDEALRSGAELIVHAYPNGEAPGLKRLAALGLAARARVLPAPGTSEDVAMLVAFEQQAKLIVALGTHTHMVDFLEKGRKGMASTMLVRMKIGTKLVDAKGVSLLYTGRYRGKELTWLVLSSVLPLLSLFGINPEFRSLLRLLWLNVRLMFS
ncbi:putative cytokinetic ring protein SteA [Numidum massiliense]|uniref:putative cytokinetic ring protein SteA n=1 Tax=Numidum massiliense TaxID=1522315 RepID=UPI0006D58AF0|nr:putative cytokinetic ring protein SteA [Numidum massiliense]